MNQLIDPDTERLLSDSLRDMLAGGGDVASGLHEMGWSDVTEIDAPAASRLLFTELGRSGRASAQLDNICTAAAGLPQSRVIRVVHPLRDTSTPGVIEGVLLSPLDSCEVVVGVVAGAPATAVRIDTSAAVASLRPVGGFDAGSALAHISIPAEQINTAPAEGDWERAVSRARVALSWELIGNAEAMLALATAQISQRQQFGRPIGSNQSPRHRMAEAHTKIVAARELAVAAQQADDSWTALTAKAYAGMAWDTVMRGCLQVCGAIGLTAEHPLGALVRRGAVLESLYGNWRDLTARIGSDLLSSRTIPIGVAL